MIKTKPFQKKKKKLHILPREHDSWKGKSGYFKQKGIQTLLFDWARSEAIFYGWERRIDNDLVRKIYTCVFICRSFCCFSLSFLIFSFKIFIYLKLPFYLWFDVDASHPKWVSGFRALYCAMKNWPGSPCAVAWCFRTKQTNHEDRETKSLVGLCI